MSELIIIMALQTEKRNLPEDVPLLLAPSGLLLAPQLVPVTEIPVAARVILTLCSFLAGIELCLCTPGLCWHGLHLCHVLIQMEKAEPKLKSS